MPRPNPPSFSLWQLFLAMRPNQWVKNIIILAAFIFALGDREQQVNLPALISTFMAVYYFCLVSSSIYIFNDLKDADLDRHHPSKKFRPIASGRVAPRTAFTLAVGLALFSACGAWILSSEYFLILATYFLMQVAYTLGLKRLPLVDVLVIALGFVLRALAGAVVIDVQISPWLLLCTLLLALFLGLSKRRHEKVVLRDLKDAARPSLQWVSEKTFDNLLLLVAGATMMAYSLYTISPDTVEKFGGQKLVLTIPLVGFGLFRFYHLVYLQEKGGMPERELLTDVPMLMIVSAYGLTVLALLLLF